MKIVKYLSVDSNGSVPIHILGMKWLMIPIEGRAQNRFLCESFKYFGGKNGFIANSRQKVTPKSLYQFYKPDIQFLHLFSSDREYFADAIFNYSHNCIIIRIDITIVCLFFFFFLIIIIVAAGLFEKYIKCVVYKSLICKISECK